MLGSDSGSRLWDIGGSVVASDVLRRGGAAWGGCLVVGVSGSSWGELNGLLLVVGGSEVGGGGSLLESHSEGSVLASQGLDLSVQISDLVLVLESDVPELSLELLVPGLEGSNISSGVGGDERSEVGGDVVPESGEFLGGLGELHSQELNGS